VPVPDPDTAEQLMAAAWPYCGIIQDIIDRLNETGSNTELRLLTPTSSNRSLIEIGMPASASRQRAVARLRGLIAAA